MTWHAIRNLLNGSDVYCFPGYKVMDDNGKVVSTEMDVDKWIMLPKELNNATICIDEMNNFFDAYRFGSVMARLFGSLAQQRRKRNLHILATVQDIQWLPPRLRWLVHVTTTCWDLHWKFHNIPKGTAIVVRSCDNKGLYTGHPGRWGRPKLFKGKKVWPHYDTDEIVDILNQFTQVKIHGTQVDIWRGQRPEDRQLPPGNEISYQNMPPIPIDYDDIPLDFRDDMIES